MSAYTKRKKRIGNDVGLLWRSQSLTEAEYIRKCFCVTLPSSNYKNFFQMALQPKTFRTSDDVIKALKDKATELDISESDIINKALKCFLGLGIDHDCDTSHSHSLRSNSKLSIQNSKLIPHA
ncbi:hypothetical protein LC605_31210 [Nostoc sp. CHAB 5836]|uniref:hypothetical protein n=1 Tax=Nostoc sp. CHAB 5836 TaxID=2780404 RepID=UPI001E436D23|nr:hypothetical protein [Nostoc sp. CHAB 5836]MCC5619445.1 hypothetical protein [Nostoc sp. CHAB 5836]